MPLPESHGTSSPTPDLPEIPDDALDETVAMPAVKARVEGVSERSGVEGHLAFQDETWGTREGHPEPFRASPGLEAKIAAVRPQITELLGRYDAAHKAGDEAAIAALDKEAEALWSQSIGLRYELTDENNAGQKNPMDDGSLYRMSERRTPEERDAQERYEEKNNFGLHLPEDVYYITDPARAAELQSQGRDLMQMSRNKWLDVHGEFTPEELKGKDQALLEALQARNAELVDKVGEWALVRKNAKVQAVGNCLDTIAQAQQFYDANYGGAQLLHEPIDLNAFHVLLERLQVTVDRFLEEPVESDPFETQTFPAASDETPQEHTAVMPPDMVAQFQREAQNRTASKPAGGDDAEISQRFTTRDMEALLRKLAATGETVATSASWLAGKLGEAAGSAATGVGGWWRRRGEFTGLSEAERAQHQAGLNALRDEEKRMLAAVGGDESRLSEYDRGRLEEVRDDMESLQFLLDFGQTEDERLSDRDDSSPVDELAARRERKEQIALQQEKLERLREARYQLAATNGDTSGIDFLIEEVERYLGQLTA